MTSYTTPGPLTGTRFALPPDSYVRSSPAPLAYPSAYAPAPLTYAPAPAGTPPPPSTSPPPPISIPTPSYVTPAPYPATLPSGLPVLPEVVSKLATGRTKNWQSLMTPEEATRYYTQRALLQSQSGGKLNEFQRAQMAAEWEPVKQRAQAHLWEHQMLVQGKLGGTTQVQPLAAPSAASWAPRTSDEDDFED